MEKRSIFSINIPVEYRSMANDLTRMMSLQVFTHYLFYLTDPTKYVLFGADFVRILLFLIISVVFYWLIVRKIILYDKNSKEKEHTFFYGE